MSKSIYAPLYSEQKLEKESHAAYIRRIQPLLPRFPEDILIQWFYDHDQQIKNHEWLNYPSLRFDKNKWSTDKIPTENYGNAKGVKINMEHHFKGSRNIYTDRLVSYFEHYGTWPVPPIFLPNPDGNIKYPDGYQCGMPYHLIEGHHRMAFFFIFKEKNKLASVHDVYIITHWDKAHNQQMHSNVCQQ